MFIMNKKTEANFHIATVRTLTTLLNCYTFIHLTVSQNLLKTSSEHPSCAEWCDVTKYYYK